MVMPKMGESIMEGTILKWLKKEGDSINEDESVLEVATDKVDTEIPSTCSGTISQILVNEGDIVKVGSPIAIIETEQNTGSKTIDSDYVKDLESSFSEIKNDITSPPEIKDKNKTNFKSEKFFSPLVLNIASRENISLSDLENINGTGENSRVTKYDLLKFLEDKNEITQDIVNDEIKIEEEIILKAFSVKKAPCVAITINSPGGSISAGLAIYDTMQFITPNVATICTGIAASMGAVLLCAGHKGKRSALPHARVMIHQPLGGAQGQASDIEITAREILKLKDELYQIISKHSGQSFEKVTEN